MANPAADTSPARCGWDQIAVYDGGWFEWSKDPDSNPIKVGEPDEGAAA